MYNLFHILKIRHYESRVHTPFLVNLLSPKGSHAQGDLFYRVFLEQVFRNDGGQRVGDTEGSVSFLEPEAQDSHASGLRPAKILF
jgi:hypothetical protein